MASHATISPGEAADRVAIRELVERLRRLRGPARRQGPDGPVHRRHPVPRVHGPRLPRNRRSSCTDASRWRLCSTTSTSTPPPCTSTGRAPCPWTGTGRTGESYCLAHHLSVGEDGQRTMMIASIRYLDEFVKQDGEWFFAERRLMVNWTETRPSAA